MSGVLLRVCRSLGGGLVSSLLLLWCRVVAMGGVTLVVAIAVFVAVVIVVLNVGDGGGVVSCLVVVWCCVSWWQC